MKLLQIDVGNDVFCKGEWDDFVKEYSSDLQSKLPNSLVLVKLKGAQDRISLP
jgi:hypothetical protein